MKKIYEIIDTLINKRLIINDHLEVKQLKSGTTNGILYTLLFNETPTYVVKMDSPDIITATKDFLVAYDDVRFVYRNPILSQLLTEPVSHFIFPVFLGSTGRLYMEQRA